MGFHQPSPPIRALYGDIVAALREAFKDVPGAVVRTFESFNPDGHIPKPTCAVYVKLPNIPPPKKIWQDDVYYGERLVRVSMQYGNGGTYWWVEVYTGKKVWGSRDFPTPKDTVDIAMVVLSEKMGIPAPQPAPVPENPEMERLRAAALGLLLALDAHEDTTDSAYHPAHKDAVYAAKTTLRNVLIGKSATTP